MFPSLDTLTIKPYGRKTSENALRTYLNFVRNTVERFPPSSESIRELYFGDQNDEVDHPYKLLLRIAGETLPAIHAALRNAQTFPLLRFVDLELKVTVHALDWRGYLAWKQLIIDMMPNIPGIHRTFFVRFSTVGTYLYFGMGDLDRGKGCRFICIWVLTGDMAFPESGPSSTFLVMSCFGIVFCLLYLTLGLTRTDFDLSSYLEG